MASFFFRSFSHLGIHELRDAFRLGAGGFIHGVGPSDFTAWHGNFSVAGLGKILSAYDQYRILVLVRLQNLTDQETSETREEKRRAYWASPEGEQRRADWMTDRIQKLLSIQNPTYKNVTVYDFMFLENSGLITRENLTYEHRVHIMAQAQSCLFNEYKIRRLRAGSDVILANEISTAISILERGGTTSQFDDEAKAIARRMAVARWIQSQQEKNPDPVGEN
jgi:hypothetical protein